MQNPVERPCPECGGRRIVCTADVVYRLPTAMTDRSMLAVVCTNCGYSALYAQQLADFARMLEKNQAAVEKKLQENAQKLAEGQNWRRMP
jgi:predicted nucleic-acid-binding Zn-ribbon protein